MQYFDLHCDTLYKAAELSCGLNDPAFEVRTSVGKTFRRWCQCMAIWIPDEISEDDAFSLFTHAHGILTGEASCNNIRILSCDNKFEDHTMLFTVENGKLLGNDISRIKMLAEHNVKMLTLTWNAENYIGGGADAQSAGLSSFGKECIRELENNNIVVDISHASDKTFYDVLECSTRPIVASHSNSRKVCDHRRNLTDDQFNEIVKRGGIVGLNFHKDFLSDKPENAAIKDVLLHAEHFLSLGGEDSLSIGSDFDGSDIPKDLNNLQKIHDLCESFIKIGYNEQLVQKIMFYNAYNFFSRF